jgi:hypothetical protein
MFFRTVFYDSYMTERGWCGIRGVAGEVDVSLSKLGLKAEARDSNGPAVS